MRTPRGRIREITKLPQRVALGYLAEEYDGIGQYVKITLAKSSVAAAYKARVAAGDFGGGRTFPVGTRVPVFSYRGQLEVLLGNHPRIIEAITICGETYTRTVVSGHGNCEWGGVWDTFVGTYNQSTVKVNGTEGVFLSTSFSDPIGSDPDAMVDLPQPIAFPFEFLMKLKFPTGVYSTYDGVNGAVSYGIDVFNGNTRASIDLQLNIGPTWPPTDLSLIIGRRVGTFIPADQQSFHHEIPNATDKDLLLRVRVESDRVKARIWPASDVEPSTWREATAGGGLMSASDMQQFIHGIFGFDDDVPLGVFEDFVRIDSIEFTAGAPCSPPVTEIHLDDFDRVTGPYLTGIELGPFDIGSSREGPWEVSATATGSGLDTIGTDGDIFYADIGYTPIVIFDSPQYDLSGLVTLGLRFRLMRLPVGSGFMQVVLNFDNDGGEGSLWLFISPTGQTYGFVQLDGSDTSDFFDKNDWQAGEWYQLKLERNGTAVRAKVWLDSEAEPDWQLNAVNLSSPTPNIGVVHLSLDNASDFESDETIYRWEVDWIDDGLGS